MGIKDIFDILIVATLLYYLYRIMKESGAINIFYGVLAFIVVWAIGSELLELRLIGTILDRFMSIGLLILVILFQDQLKRFLVELGSRKRWHILSAFFHHKKSGQNDDTKPWVMPLVYACMSMSKTKTGALIVIEQAIPLDDYEKTGDIIDANINTRLIENIFFKNSPLHDGALIIAKDRLVSAGCILPVSHDTNVPRSMGLRHRSALGISQASDAIAVVVSEETGNISIAHRGRIRTRVNSVDLEQTLNKLLTSEQK